MRLAHRLVSLPLLLALDRAAINQVVYNGMFTPTMQAVPRCAPVARSALRMLRPRVKCWTGTATPAATLAAG